MLTLGQKTTLRKSIRPFESKFQSLAKEYDNLNPADQSARMEELGEVEEAMMREFEKLKPHMDKKEIDEYTRQIVKAGTPKDEKDQDEFDFEDGFQPVPRPSADPNPEPMPEPRPQVMGCLGQQIQKKYKAKQADLELGE